MGKLWQRYISGGNINKTLADIHTRYGKLEYLLPALYVLYCLVPMQLIAKSFEAVGGLKGRLAAAAKLFLLHAVVCLGMFIAISSFSDSQLGQLLENFLTHQLPSAFIALLIPIACMVVAFLLSMFNMAISKK